MSVPAGIWFVYRSHYEGPLSKRVHRVAAPSILAFFQALVEEARISMAPRDVADGPLGGRVYGLGSLFEKVKELSLHTPKATAALKKLLVDHLHVEGGEEHIQCDAHTLRVLTNDDEVALAYYLFDDETAKKAPHRAAWLLHEEPRLPDGDADGVFRPEGVVDVLGPAGGGEGATYAVLLTFADSDSIPGTVGVFPGVRLPGLAAHLRAVTPDTRPGGDSGEFLETWPVELRLLRAMLDEGDTTLAPALRRAAAYPLGALAAQSHTRVGVGPFASARAEFLAAAEKLAHTGDPAKSIVHEGAHAALLAAHASEHLGYQQWILFDDRWAAANSGLAASILHYGRDWDPFAVVHTPKPAKEAKPAKESKPAKAAKPAAEPKSARAPKSTRPTRAQVEADAAAARHDAAWKKAVGGGTVEAARPYAPSERYAEGDLIHHAKFGLGVVTQAGPNKLEAIFSGAPRVLVHGVK